MCGLSSNSRDPRIPSSTTPDETRKVERDDATVTTGQDAHSITPIRTAGEEKTVLFRPSPNRSGEGTMFNPLAPKGESGGSEDPVVGWLVIVKGPGRGNAVRLGYGWNSIGRDASQRACLDFGDSQISRLNHAKLLYDPRARKFTLTLGESTNPHLCAGATCCSGPPKWSAATASVGRYRSALPGPLRRDVRLAGTTHEARDRFRRPASPRFPRNAG
ncbi:MAG: FHA domain-containing protein [Chthoniobacter sp.]